MAEHRRTEALNRDRGSGHEVSRTEVPDPPHRARLHRAIGNQATLALLANSGQPLPATTRREFEMALRAPLNDVRVHTDSEATRTAAAAGARAYTAGNHIVFGAGQFSPQPPAGRRLLSHELAHVLQQRLGSGMRRTADGSPHHEQEADAVADRLERASEASPSQQPSTAPGGSLTGAPAGMAQYQLFGLPLAAGGRTGGLMERDRRNTMNQPDPKTLTAGPEANLSHATIHGSSAITNLDNTAMNAASVAQRISMLEHLVGALWTGSSEETSIIRILDTVPVADAPEMVRRLERHVLDKRPLMDELERVVDLGNNLLLYDALSRLRLRARPPATAISEVIRAPILPFHSVMGFTETNATFAVRRTTEGKVRVLYHGSLWGYRTDFTEEVHQLPMDLFLGSGHDFDPDELVVVHDYDRDRFVPMVAQDLIGYRNQIGRDFLIQAAEVSSLALPLGPAKSIGGRAAMVVIEKVVPTLLIVVNENRRNIVKWFPEWGPRVLFVFDVIQMGLALYGIVRFAQGSAQIVKSWRELRTARAMLDQAPLDPHADEVLRLVERDLDSVTTRLDDIRVAEETAAAASKVKNAGPAQGAQVTSLEGRPKAGTVPGLEKVPAGQLGVTDLADVRARKPGGPPPSEPSAQVIPVPQEQVRVGDAKLAAGAELHTPSTGGMPEVASAGKGGKGGGVKMPPQSGVKKPEGASVGAPGVETAVLRGPDAPPVSGGVVVPLTDKEVLRLSRLGKILRKGGKWSDLSAKDRWRLGKTFDKIIQSLAQYIRKGGPGQVLHAVDVDAALIGKLRAAGGRATITEGRLGAAGRFDLLDIDFKTGKIEVMDVTSLSYRDHVEKTLGYKKALAKLTGLPVEAIETRYVGTDGALLDVLLNVVLKP